MATGDYICVYDAKMPCKKNALYFVKKCSKDQSVMWLLLVCNKTRNAGKTLDPLYQQEIVVTLGFIMGMWHLFKRLDGFRN